MLIIVNPWEHLKKPFMISPRNLVFSHEIDHFPREKIPGIFIHVSD
jgi:hypothetical protein